MERIDDIGKADYRLIRDVPACCNDTKPSAFGKRDGVIKIRDYGMVNFSDLLNQSLVEQPAFALNARMQAVIDESSRGCQFPIRSRASTSSYVECSGRRQLTARMSYSVALHHP